MKRVRVMGFLLLLLGGLSACHDSQAPDGSSGSNWLVCDTLADCDHPDAVRCDDGYCADQDGERLLRPETPGDGDTSNVPGDGDLAGDGDTPNGPGDGDASSVPGDGDQVLEDRPKCAWGVDEMLAEVGLEAKDRVSCGGANGAFESGIIAGMECFEQAIGDGQAVEFTINDCTDCSIPTTYVALPTGERFAFYMEADMFGDELLVSRIQRCDTIDYAIGVEQGGVQVNCASPETLYSCSEPRSFAREVPQPPIKPHKLSDVPPSDPEYVLPLHLYVSNQSFTEPLVSLSVLIEGTAVVVGDFPVEGQHTWLLFELTAPLGTLNLEAGASFADRDETATLQLEMPAETWAVLEYWGYDEEGGGEPFTLSVSGTPVAFN